MWSVWLWVFPFGDIQVHLWMLWCEIIALLIMGFLDMAQFTTLSPLSLLISCELSFSIVILKLSSLPTSNLRTKFSCDIYGISQMYVPIPHRNCPSYQQFYPLLGHVHSKQLYQWPLSIIYGILLHTHSTLLAADMIPFCTKNPVPNSWFSFPFP
jgi:hypothetical protein